MISKKFILTSIGSGISSLAYLILSRVLDNFIYPVYADIIGKILDLTLDFIFQSYIFLDKINPNKISLYLIGKLISTFTSILLFYLYINYSRNPKIDNTYIRMLISSTVFFVVVYPFTKYVVFKKD